MRVDDIECIQNRMQRKWSLLIQELNEKIMERERLEDEKGLTYFATEEIDELVSKVIDNKHDHRYMLKALKELMEECYELGYDAGKSDY